MILTIKDRLILYCRILRSFWTPKPYRPIPEVGKAVSYFQTRKDALREDIHFQAYCARLELAIEKVKRITGKDISVTLTNKFGGSSTY